MLLDFSYIGAPPSMPTDSLHRLFATDKTTVYFTNADLLVVNVGRQPPVALLIDLYPKLEENPEGPRVVSNADLMWTTLLLKRIDALAMDEPSRTALAEKFSAQFRVIPYLARGEITLPLLVVEPDSPLSKEVGIRAIIGLSARVPSGERLPAGARRLPTKYSDAIAKAFEEAGRSGVQAIAIPFMPIADTIAREPPSNRDAWLRLLQIVLAGARTGTVSSVTIGAYALDRGNRERLHAEFGQAWGQFRETLPKTPSALHEPLRMGMFALIGMLLAAWRQQWEMSSRRVLIVVVVSTMIASSLSGVFAWLEPVTSDVLSPIVIVLCKYATALLGGFFARQLLSFDARREFVS